MGSFNCVKATAQDEDSFPLWRKMEFDHQQNRFAGQKRHSFTPLEYLQIRETKLIISLWNTQPYFSIWSNMTIGSLTTDYFFLARFCGIIDHLKAVQNESESILDLSNGKPTLNMQAIGIISIFEGIDYPSTTEAAEEILQKYWHGKINKSSMTDLREFHNNFKRSNGFFSNLDHGGAASKRIDSFLLAIEWLEGSQKLAAEETLKEIRKRRNGLIEK